MSRYVFQKGFNLVELLVVIAIVAILMVIAAPNFQSYTANQQVRTANDALLRTLNLARSEAVTRNTEVTITRDTEWVNGWTVASGGNILRVHEALQGVTVDVTPNDTNAITYNRDGRIDGVAIVSFSLSPQSAAGAEQRCVRVGLSGAAASTKGDCS